MNKINDMTRTYQFNGVLFNPVKHELTNAAAEISISLSYTESKILELFLQSHGEVISKESLLKHAWGGRVVADASVAKTISNLRVTIKQCGIGEDVIITAPRMGYKFVGQVDSNDLQHENEFSIQSITSSTEDAKPTIQQEDIKPERGSPPSFIISFLSGMKRYVFHSEKVYVITVCLIIIFTALSTRNMSIILDSKRAPFYIDPEFEKSQFNRSFLIYKKSNSVPEWISKVETEMPPGNTIFFNQSDNFIDIAIYNPNSTNGSINYSFSKKAYDEDYIVNYLKSEMKNEK